MSLYRNSQGQDCIVEHAIHFCTQIEHRSLEQDCGSHLRHSCSLVWICLNLTRIIFNYEYRTEAPQLQNTYKLAQREGMSSFFVSITEVTTKTTCVPMQGLLGGESPQTFTQGRQHSVIPSINPKWLYLVFQWSSPAGSIPFLSWLCKACPLATRRSDRGMQTMWPHVRMPVGGDGVLESEFFCHQGILLSPASLTLGNCPPIGKGLGYKDSRFLLMTNTVRVPQSLVSYQVLLPGKERGQDLNADIKII